MEGLFQDLKCQNSTFIFTIPSVFPTRRAFRLQLLAATQWWRLKARGCEVVSTPGVSQKVEQLRSAPGLWVAFDARVSAAESLHTLCFTVENSAHCDFVKLRNMLIRTHMQDLKDVTRETHYENYRAHCIQSMTRMVVKERNRKYAQINTAGLTEE